MKEEDQEMDSFEMRMRKKPKNHMNLNENNAKFLRRTDIGKRVKEGVHQRRQMEMDKSTLVNNSFQLGLWKGTVVEKMFEKMGYKGGGLGPNEQGMFTPIEVKAHPKNAGLGSLDKHSVLNQSHPSVIQRNKSQNQNRNCNQKPKLYSDCAQRTKEEKKNHITVEELLGKKNRVQVLDVVYDMRGKQVKVLTSLENLNGEEESIPMAELIHKRVSLCEVDILKIDQDLKIERGAIVALRKERGELEHDAACQGKQLYSMSEIANELERLSSQCRLGLLTLKSLTKSFGDLQKVFPEEYELFGLSTIACSFALDMFHRLFCGWDPLVKPEDDHHLSVVSIWKDFLRDDEISDSLYSRLFMEVVFPAVRISITNTWQPKHPEPLLRFLDSWEELLPQLVLQTILDHVVMPKLSDAVDSWDQRQDTIPIHVWIHPWLVLLGHKLEVLYPTIRTKLEHVLRDWQPSDASAYTVLSPWEDVFNRGTWERIMISCIAPKLLVVMRELEINPADQKLEHFHWVQTWAGLIPVDHMLQIMDVFFDKWQMALYQWLRSNPNYQEVNDWFVGWRNLIPSELLSTARVRSQLKVGLDMMNQAVEGLEVVEPGPTENLSDIKARNQSRFLAQQKAAAAAAQAEKTGMNDMSLREVIEVHAQGNDLLFKPKPGRMQDGHQVYGFGNISIIIDALNQKVFAQTEEGWSSVTLEKLVMLGKTTAMKWR